MRSSPENPWEQLSPPGHGRLLMTRRVDPDHPWNFFWARGADTIYLVLQHKQRLDPGRELPRFKGLKVSDVPNGSSIEGFLLLFELLEPEHTQLFHRLCLDIVASTAEATEERSAVEAAIGRTWRWHHLLRGGRDERLSIDSQRGLVGELLVITELLQPRIGGNAAVSAWTGPLDTPKDFELGPVAIEHKARRSSARPSIRITSEHQLDHGSGDLYLVVRDVDQVPCESDGAQCLTDFVHTVLNLPDLSSSGALDFEARLAAAAYRGTDDYADVCWTAGKRRVYHVTAGFPRLVATELPDGVRDTSYTIDLAAVSPFEIEPESMEVPRHADEY